MAKKKIYIIDNIGYTIEFLGKENLNTFNKIFNNLKKSILSEGILKDDNILDYSLVKSIYNHNNNIFYTFTDKLQSI